MHWTAMRIAWRPMLQCVPWRRATNRLAAHSRQKIGAVRIRGLGPGLSPGSTRRWHDVPSPLQQHKRRWSLGRRSPDRVGGMQWQEDRARSLQPSSGERRRCATRRAQVRRMVRGTPFGTEQYHPRTAIGYEHPDPTSSSRHRGRELAARRHGRPSCPPDLQSYITVRLAGEGRSTLFL